MVSKNELKFIKSLKLKKHRTFERLFCVEGRKNILELLDSDLVVDRIIGLESFVSSLTNTTDAELSVITHKQLQSLSSFITSDAGIALVKMPPEIDFQYTHGHLIALDGVRDPGNLGTIIRTLDWFGFSDVLCSHDCTDFYNPKTIAATMGSFTRIRAHYVDLPSFLQHANTEQVYGLVLDGEKLETEKLGDGIYILGSESHGIGEGAMTHVKRKLSIPRYGNAESLNVAMACGILLHAIKNS